MLEKFIYENHLGQRFEGVENGVFLNANDLRDYSWSYDTINNKITRFYRSIKPRKLPLVIFCASDDEAVKVKNRLYEIAEADIVAEKAGKVIIGDYYTKGYITESKKSSYLIDKRYCKLDLTLTSDDSAWYKETTHVFKPDNKGENSIIGGADYPFDYAFDYAFATNGSTLMCDSVGDSAFKLLIYGYAINPTIGIGGHFYTVEGTIGEGEFLLIDSVSKTITLTTATGKKVNWFDKRGRTHYIFEPIPAGRNIISWNGEFGFDLTIVEKRSEPKWT